MSRRATYRAIAAGIVIVLLAALVTGVLLLRASSSEASGQGESTEAESANVVAPELRNFEDYPVYYLGESFEGLPLTAELPGDTAVSLVYGSCEPSEDTGCAPPLEVQVWPACKRNPSTYELAPGIPMPRQEDTIRRVPAAFYEDGFRLELSTGSVTVVIFGEHEQIVRAAQALRGLNSSQAPEEDLPPPAPGAIEGTLACS
jgi:hypothetical protein